MDPHLTAMQRYWGARFRWWKVFFGLLISWLWGLLSLSGDEEPTRTLFGFASLYLSGFIAITFRAWLIEISPVYDLEPHLHPNNKWNNWRNYLALIAFLIVLGLGVISEKYVMETTGLGVGPR